jgi:Spy/CpxP family protein refolding chaperone
MKNKTKTSFILLGTLVIGFIIGAIFSGIIRQQKIHQISEMHEHERFIKGMEKIIQPSEEQKEKIDKILKKRSQKITEIRKKYQEEIATIFDSLHQDMAEVLTDQQKERLENQMQRFSSRMIQTRLEHMTTVLGLSDEQRQQIEKMMKDMEEEMRERIKSRQKPDKNWRDNRQDWRGGARDIFEKYDKEIEALLTPEQKIKFREMKAPREPGRKGFRDFRPGPGLGPRPGPDSLFEPLY